MLHFSYYLLQILPTVFLILSKVKSKLYRIFNSQTIFYDKINVKTRHICSMLYIPYCKLSISIDSSTASIIDFKIDSNNLQRHIGVLLLNHRSVKI
jgi:hypothetical protein